MAEPSAKKFKAAENDDCAHLLDGFQVKKILLNDVKSKKVHILGTFKDSKDDAIVSLSKTPFTEEKVKFILSKDTSLAKEFSNDIYGTFVAETSPHLNTITTNTIHPATEKHIMKFTSQNLFLLSETAEDHQNITLPYLEKQQFRIDWVYNILEHKKEADRILYEDPDKEIGFIVLPDLKWDGKQVEDLYVTGICHARNIKSIRDLNLSHLPMLKNMLQKGLEIIEEKYKVSKHQIRAYFHYLPSYFHLHVHFVHIKNDMGGMFAGKAHLVSDVIDNIENVSSDFYSKKTLPVTLREQDPLLKLLLKKTVVDDKE